MTDSRQEANFPGSTYRDIRDAVPTGRKLRYICTICHQDAGRRRVVTLPDGRHYGPVCDSKACQDALTEREQGTRLSA